MFVIEDDLNDLIQSKVQTKTVLSIQLTAVYKRNFQDTLKTIDDIPRTELNPLRG